MDPYKVVNAPELKDDFYLTLLDWSSQNLLAVGLNQRVFLWKASDQKAIKLCDFSSEDVTFVTSVQWTENGDFLAVGTNHGIVQLHSAHSLVDEIACRMKRAENHTSRKESEAVNRCGMYQLRRWYTRCRVTRNGDIICSGSKDTIILQRDVRSPPGYSEKRLTSHRQEVCGLKWSPDKQYLASGGQDHKMMVWSLRRPEPCLTYTEHNAAVKALAWSPHHHGLLVSGGGTTDKCLRFWNTLTGQPMQCIDTGSQECNVAWSKHSPELVSTHGYWRNGDPDHLGDKAVTWKYPVLRPMARMVHPTRVKQLAMSPDGESIATAGADECIRLWRVFGKRGEMKMEH